jgi:SNF2 family DNA or RNA helicase
MNIDGYTYLIYDKFYNDHNFNNLETMNIKIDDIFTGNDFYEYSDEKAIEEFNKFGSIYKMPTNLDKLIYKVYMFIKKQEKSKPEMKFTIISVSNEKIKSYVDFKDIPNLDFLTSVCRYHAMYEKSRKLNGKLDICFNQPVKIMEEVIAHVSNKVGEPSDPIIENPPFLTCSLYNYQKRSVNWMVEREKMINEINYNLNDEIIFGDYYYDIVRQVFCKNTDRKILEFRGGALIDEVGLGKTVQMTTVSILNQPKNNSYYQMNSRLFSRATLIICPNQLAGQWKREIEKMVDIKSLNMNIISILTKVHFDKYTYQDILDADFVIVSSAFLENKCYIEKIIKGLSTNKNYLKSSEFNIKSLSQQIDKLAQEDFDNPLVLFDTNVNIMSLYYHRIIIDEFHEIFTVDKFNHVGNILPILKANYKWAVTGTPFNKDSICLLKMLEFATNFKNNYEEKIFNVEQITNYMKNNFFRHNTKKSIMDEYTLQPIKETILWLKFSSTERMMYNAYLANPNNDKFSVFLRQICCHPKLADEVKESLSNCKTLDDIQQMMVSHYQTNMKQAQKKLKLSEIRQEVYSTLLKRYEVKRMKRLLKQQNYKVIVEYLPEIDKSLVETLKNDINDIEDEDNFDINMDFNDNLDDESSDDEVKKKTIGTVTIKEHNHQEIITNIGYNLWNSNKITLDTMKENLNRIITKVTLLKKEYEGKKTTYEFYNNVMEKIKKTVEKGEKEDNSDSNSDSDSDSDDEEVCGICLGDIPEDDIGVTKCGHMFCYECIKTIIPQKHQCPYCKKGLKDNEIFMISYERKKKDEGIKQEIKDKNELINKVGTKLANLIFFLKNSDKHTIIFSQWDSLLKKVGEVLNDYGITNVFCKGNIWQRDKAIRTFNSDENIKVIMLSSDSAASGSNLTKASQVILLDPIYGPYEFRRNTEWQAIGRAHRMGQTKQVEVIRLIIKDTIEEEIYKKNLEEDKKFIENIKIFESTDDTINLSKEKLEELIKINKDNEEKKPAKKVKVKKSIKKVIDDSDNE